ncbi:hypothetical protein [Prevotella intermedia]|uniref:hypothetical protein n=1 Tax=Prevotella intermedia TaxID=28131 RepID=UPI001557E2DF|nr:hypothetical protein [Prevotella intermedia]
MIRNILADDRNTAIGWSTSGGWHQSEEKVQTPLSNRMTRTCHVWRNQELGRRT